MSTLSAAARALVAGAVCLAIVGGMLVGHAWPLWTGEVVRMKVQPVDPRDLFRGEFVRLSMPANRLIDGEKPAAQPGGGGGVYVRAAGSWTNADERARRLPRGSVVYVQLDVAIAASGRARIRNLVVDGQEVGR